MLEILIAGGWAMVPILLCSAIALAIILERFWSLRRSDQNRSRMMASAIAEHSRMGTIAQPPAIRISSTHELPHTGHGRIIPAFGAALM